MRTTEKITVTVAAPTAHAVRAHAQRQGTSVSAVTDRALRAYLVAEALRTEPGTDADWLAAVADTLSGGGQAVA